MCPRIRPRGEWEHSDAGVPDADEGVPGEGGGAERGAMIGLLYVNCLKNNNSQVTGLDPMALCVFRQFLLEAEGSPFLEADLSVSAHARVIACDFFSPL